MKILIIDDETLIRQSLQYISELRGHKTWATSTGEEGLIFWKSFQPDIVFLDLILPDQNGFKIMEQQPYLAQIVMMSAYAQYKEEAKNKKANLFLIKPFENIFQTFDQVIQELSPHPDSELSL